MKMTITVGVLLVLLLHTEVDATFLKINNNRYDDLVVAISPDIKENPTIITKIQDMITDASPFLYGATRNRTYFGNVKILVPETWTYKSSWTSASVETFEEADIRIDKPHPLYGSNPYTYQPEGCGDPGKYIHLTEEYVLDKEGSGIYTWGPAGRLIVHEFSHLRYGVFDEYGLGTKEYPNFYLEDNVVYPTACTDSIRGNLEGNCTTDPLTNLPSDDCYFLGDLTQNTARVSIMYDFAIHPVTTFCESNTNDPAYLHNSLAPNQQNKMCNNRGTWDVVKEHADFNSANHPVSMSQAQLKPTFQVLYSQKKSTATSHGTESCGRPVVLVLDISGSMILKNRLFKQRQTADKLIKDILPVGTEVAVVTFSTDARTDVPLTKLSTRADRDRVSKQLPTKTEGSTAIGRGLLQAKWVLQAAGKMKVGRIVLITDGEENEFPNVTEVKPEIINAGIRVHTVAYSPAAAHALRELSYDSGGQYAYYSESAHSSALDATIEKLMKDISICDKQVRIEVMRKAVVMTPSTPIQGSIEIDSTLTNDTMFVFTLPHGVPVTVTLKAPDSRVYSTNSPSSELDFDSGLNIVRFNFGNAEVGRWHYTLVSSRSGTVSLVVKALPGYKKDPYEIESWLSSTQADLSKSQPAVVYVRVHKGYSPVIKADVTVTVERPTAGSVVVKPRDDGTLPDNLADDGVYSVYFTQFSGNQRYSLDVDVKSVYGHTKYIKTVDGNNIYVNGSSTFSGALPRYHNVTTNYTTVLAGNFTRTSTAGALDVKGFVAGKDMFAPNRVTDLKVVSFNSKQATVTLTWTSPGDDADHGTASDYEIRMAHTSQRLLSEFDKCLIIDPSKVIEGSLKPSVANTREQIKIRTPPDWTTIAFGLRTIDDEGNRSGNSNIAVATFKQVSLAENTTQQPVPTPVTSSNSKSDSSVIIGIACGIVVAVMIVAMVLIFLFKRSHVPKVVQIPESPLTAEKIQPSAPPSNTHYVKM